MPLIVPGVTNSFKSPQDKWTNMLVGKTLGDKSNETSFAKGELPQKHRVLEEGGMATMDHVPDRLNVHVGKDGVVQKVTHG